MSDDLTPRDVIARDLHQLCVDRWNQFDGASTRHGVEVHHKTADVAVAALDAAGWSITRTPDEWQWGVLRTRYTIRDLRYLTSLSEQDARNFIDPERGEEVIRRRPAGEWEVVPDVE